MCIYWVHKGVTWSRKYSSFASTFDIRQIGLIALNRFESTFEYAAATRVTKNEYYIHIFCKSSLFLNIKRPKCWNETGLALKYFCTALLDACSLTGQNIKSHLDFFLSSYRDNTTKSFGYN